jgi:hypothetical protein
MTKLLATCAALALTAAFTMPVPAGATEKRADGVRNLDQIEVSAKRKRRYVRRYYAPRYGYYRPYYYDAPYYAYAPRYYRPYYRPGVSVGVGPFGFGFGF